MSKELLLIVETVSNEKDVDQDVIFDALETALEAATRKQYKEEVDIRVSIDRETGDYTTYRCYLISKHEEIEQIGKELDLEEAQEIDPNAEYGGIVEERLENIPFGRIGAHLAKQTIIQKIREAERQKVFERFEGKEGELINGIIKRIDKGNVILDLGDNVEGMIFKEDIIAREPTRQGERMRAYIKAVSREARGHQIILSRTVPELIIELFNLEVPEVGSGLIEIKGAARDPGVRAKVAVYTDDPRIDPVGACIGMRGSRVQSITNELNGERVDIIIWSESPAEFVVNAIAPAEPISMVLDEDRKSIDMSFPEEKLAVAVGKGGQNVRLASELTGWQLNIMTEEDFAKKTEDEQAKYTALFVEKLNIEEDIAEILVREGYSSIDEISYVDIEELYEIEEFDNDIVDEIRERVSDILITQAISAEEEIEDSNPISTLEGMDENLLMQVRLNGIQTWDDLAELSTDELVEITGQADEDAAKMILAARAPWFE